MPADLEQELNELGARLLAEAPAVTSDEVIRFVSERRFLVSPIDPLIRDVPALADITEIATVRRPSRRSVMLASVAAASVLVVGLGLATDLSDDGDSTAVGTSPATDAAVTSPAPTTVATGQTPIATNVEPGANVSWPPRVLLDESWVFVDANERSINEGYTTFNRDGMSVYVGWYRGQTPWSAEFYADQGYTDVGTASLLGQSVTIYASPPMFATDDIRQLIESGQLHSDIIASELASVDESLASLPEGEAGFGDYLGGPILEDELAEVIDAGLIEGVSDSLEARIVWDHTSVSVQIRPLEPESEPAVDDLVAVLGALHEVESSEWEAALPDHVVAFSERAAVIDEMTTDVPLPENFTVDHLGDHELVQSRGAIADEVVKSVACAWLTQYFSATNGNSPDAAQAALDAIGSIPDWPVSQELNAMIENAAALGSESGVIPIPNSGLLSLVVNPDGTITYEGTGEVLTNDFAVDLCYVEAVG